jgi:hypothetical protein
MKLPVLQLISSGDTRWRQVHLLWQDLAASLKQLEYHELAGQLTRTMQRMPEPLCKGKVMHLLRWVPVVRHMLGHRCLSDLCQGAQDSLPAAQRRQRMHAVPDPARFVGWALISLPCLPAAGTRLLFCSLWAARVCL